MPCSKAFMKHSAAPYWEHDVVSDWGLQSFQDEVLILYTFLQAEKTCSLYGVETRDSWSTAQSVMELQFFMICLHTCRCFTGVLKIQPAETQFLLYQPG